MNFPWRIFGLLICALSLLAAAKPSPEKIRQLTLEGNRAFEQKDYEAALKKYREAQTAAPESSYMPYINFNIGTTLLEQGKHDEAVEAFRKVNSSDNPALAAWSLYNIGVGQYQQAEQAVEAQDLEKARQHLESAIQSNREAMKIAPADEDPKFNFELSRRRLEEILEKLKKQHQEKQQDKQEEKKQDQEQQQEKQSDQDQREQDSEQKQDQQQQQDQQQKQDQQEQGDRKSEEQKKQEEAERQKQQEEQKREQDKKDQQAQQQQQQPGEEKQEQPEESEAEPQPVKPGEMSPEEARRILNSLKRQDPRDLQRFLLRQGGRTYRPEKDW